MEQALEIATINAKVFNKQITYANDKNLYLP